MSETAARPGERRRLRRGIYVLPSLFTMGNVFLGFLAVVSGLDGRFERAALLVFAAGILDALDGRLARLTHSESDFGREFDSLADVLTFCMVPALLAYLWGLRHLGRIGWLVPVFYVICGATRLARFNIQTKVVDSRYFAGLPTPAAAGTVVAMLLFDPYAEWRTWVDVGLLIAVFLVGALMISTFRYRSLKKFNLRRRRSYRLAVPLAAVLILVAYKPQPVLVTLAIVYTLSGPFLWVWGRLRRSRDAGEPPPEAASADPENAT